MGKLTNRFSWSWSKGRKFNACPRAFYFAAYGSWGGWEEGAPARTRQLYMLKQSNSIHGWIGKHIHAALAEALSQRARLDRSPGELILHFAETALARMHREAKRSAAGEYKHDPKGAPALIEHVRGERIGKKWPFIKSRIHAALTGFFTGTWWPILRAVPPKGLRIEELHEFEMSGATCYCVVDCEVPPGDHPLRGYPIRNATLIDFKTSAKGLKLTDEEQVVTYALARGEDSDLVLLNPLTMTEVEFVASPADLDRARLRIGNDVDAMVKYLEQQDPGLNVPLPEKEWPLAADDDTCRWCEYQTECPKWK